MATVVALHAHPDDEVVLTGGTLARAAAAGHRVVIVTATDRRMGNEDDGPRLDELRLSAGILGVHRVECLGYADSGYGLVFHPDPPGRVRFGRADVEEAARRLATILREEDADLLLSYQRNGGYGHRDHVQVHHVGKRAAEPAATPRVLEATMPRELLRLTSDLAHLLRLPAPYDPGAVRTAYAPRATITHRIDVFRFARQKRDAFAAHRSQIGSSGRADVRGTASTTTPSVRPAISPRVVHRDGIVTGNRAPRRLRLTQPSAAECGH